jgi:outer membrane protein
MSRSHSPRWLFMLGLAFLTQIAGFGQVKIAVINSQAALAGTAEIRKAQADLETRYKPRQDAAAKLRKELDSINQQLALGDKLTPQAQADLNTQGTRRQRDLQRIEEDLQADVERERTEVIFKSGQQMQKVVQKLAEDKGLDVVVDSGNMLYFKPAFDLTKEATAAYDLAYPVKK